MYRLCLYFRPEPERDRWLPGDRFVRPALRRMVRGRPRPGGVDRVFLNLCLGLDRLGVAYEVNLPFAELRNDDRVAVLGRGRHCLDGYDRANPIVAGIGLMTHPSEWPTLCRDYPVVRYLQHSDWVINVFRPYFGDRCALWPVGIDTQRWAPGATAKEFDFLLYDKVRWDRERHERALIDPIRKCLHARGLRFAELRYGTYREEQFRSQLARCRAMIFLCEHESQGIAYQQALSCGVPVLAWDQGYCLDPDRFGWGMPEIPATSVPYFDARCGRTFGDIAHFEPELDLFLDQLRSGHFNARGYILDNLTLERCARRFIEIVDTANLKVPEPA